jgi:adenosylhomocysteine nucleosidase
MLHGQSVVLGLSGIGKVAAATTATTLITRLGVDRIIFTGVAGGLGTGVNVADVVVASELLQHDMDASPIFPRYEVPMYGKTCFACDPELTSQLLAASRAAVAGVGLAGAQVHHGLIASGDRFVSSALESRQLKAALNSAKLRVLAVEMEGAAVAQVCHDFSVPFAVVRTISDRADDTAHVDFPKFVTEVASRYAQTIISGLLKGL